MSEAITEKRNPNTKNIDEISTLEVVSLINNEDLKVAQAIQKCLQEIAKAVDIIVENFLNDGRLLYFGAGTSGRLGILDASECPPTFSTKPEMVIGVIAGGDRAIKSAIEGAEDSEEGAIADFDSLDISKNDTVAVISANGNAKYIIKILELAKQKNVKTIGITSNINAEMKNFADVFICAETGEEVISGSTRMKAGTAQKMILNMLTTASMIRIGKVYENLMIDLNPTNDKLKKRAAKIVSAIAAVEETVAAKTLQENNYKVKHSILSLKFGLSFEKCDKILKENKGILKACFKSLQE